MPDFDFSVGSGVTPDWDGVEIAVRDWVVATTGLTSVIRSSQDGPRPTAPFAEIRVDGLKAVGAVDQLVDSYDAGGDAGEEITRTVSGQRDVPVTVRCYTQSAVGSDSALALLSRAQVGLALPSARDALAAAGLAPFDAGAVKAIPGVLDTRWEGRAELTVRFYLVVEASETTGYIATADVTDTVAQG